MKTSTIISCGLLLAALVVGCGGSSEDAVVREQINLYKQMTGLAKQVTDASSLKGAEAKMMALQRKSMELEARAKNWTAEQAKALEIKYKAEIESVMATFFEAMRAAEKRAGVGFKFDIN